MISAVEVPAAARGKRLFGEDVLSPTLEGDARADGMAEDGCVECLVKLLPWPMCGSCEPESPDSLNEKAKIQLKGLGSEVHTTYPKSYNRGKRKGTHLDRDSLDQPNGI